MLPAERRDIWGTMLPHEEEKPKKIIPIKVISEKSKIDDIEVYTQARLQ